MATVWRHVAGEEWTSCLLSGFVLNNHYITRTISYKTHCYVIHMNLIINTIEIICFINKLIHSGTCKMRNEIETKRNEINRNETKFTETKRNQNEIDRNETKRNNSKWNNTYFNETIPWGNTRQKLNEKNIESII